MSAKLFKILHSLELENRSFNEIKGITKGSTNDLCRLLRIMEDNNFITSEIKHIYLRGRPPRSYKITEKGKKLKEYLSCLYL